MRASLSDGGIAAKLVAPAGRTPRRFRLSPINRRRLENFKANKRGYWSFWIFLFFFVLSLFSEFIANDKPLLVVYKSEILVPILHDLLGDESLRGLHDIGFDGFGHITYVCNPDEEIGSPTSTPPRPPPSATRTHRRLGTSAYQTAPSASRPAPTGSSSCCTNR